MVTVDSANANVVANAADAKRYALLDTDGLVVNVVLWNGGDGWSPPEGLTALPAAEGVGPGWRRSRNGKYVAPAEPVEESVPLTITPSVLSGLLEKAQAGAKVDDVLTELLTNLGG